jgi:uncharacterized protein involved in outer membrane biogenesis
MWRITAWIGIPIVSIGLVAVFWRWDWFIPIVEARASAAIGRPVTIQHLHVSLGRITTVECDGVTIANPSGWASDDPPFVAIQTLTVQADAWGYIHGNGLTLPMVGIDSPTILIAETPKGDANFRLSMASGGGPPVQISDIQITGGNAHVVIPNLKADFNTKIETQGTGDDAKIIVEATGTYAAQPITGHLVGGALLTLGDKRYPWPIDLNLANGPTRVTLNGKIDDPMAFQGANLRLKFSGPDLSLLEHLVGFPIPKTPAYEIAGMLHLHGLTRIRLEDIAGRLGNSDIEGTIEERPGNTEQNSKAKPDVTMDLRSRQVDLVDLNGFIGGTPGRPTTAEATPAERQAAAQARASSRLLPETPISTPRLQWADIHLHYHGARIEGRDMPLDDVTVVLDMDDGHIIVHPISFGVGKGRLIANVDLTPVGSKDLHAKVDLRMQNLDVSRLMAATHQFQGAGSVSGVGAIDGTGASLAAIMANGNGEVKMAMAGGSLSAVLIDLTGLQFGKALLSALGVPEQTPVQCFVGDLALRRGLLDVQAMTLDTGEAIVNVGGNINLSTETIDLGLRTDSKHFSIGSLPGRLNITGTFKNPSIRPGGEEVGRAGATAGLAVLFAPLAILPTIQFGTSDQEDARCGELLQQARASAGGKALPPPVAPAR